MNPTPTLPNRPEPPALHRPARAGPGSNRSHKVRHLRTLLRSHVEELAEQMRQGRSENLVRYLEFASRFHHYSFGNILLALHQFPNLTRIAGLRQWNRLGRRVRAGQKGILILAPMTARKRIEEVPDPEDTEAPAPQTVTFFKPVYVFDVSQTEGDPLPSVIKATGDANTLYPALKDAVQKAGIPIKTVSYIATAPQAKGASCNGKILLRKDLSPTDAFRALLHELAHELLHWNAKSEDKTIEETEADATAYVVCKHFNIHTDTADYLLLQNSTPETLLQRLETIRKTAHNIIAAIEAQGQRDRPDPSSPTGEDEASSEVRQK